MSTGRWRPSRAEQRILWYLQVLMRYVIGGGGLIYELLIDRLHDQLALVVFGLLATSMDVFGYVAALVKQARQERLAVEEAVDELESKREHELG